MIATSISETGLVSNEKDYSYQYNLANEAFNNFVDKLEKIKKENELHPRDLEIAQLVVKAVSGGTRWELMRLYGVVYHSEDQEFNIIIDRDEPRKSISIKVSDSNVRVTRISDVASTESFEMDEWKHQLGGAFDWLNSPAIIT